MDETNAPQHSNPNPPKDPNTLKACEDILAKMPIAPEYKEGGGIAAYSPRLDRVMMPNLDKLPRFLCNRFVLSLCVMLHKKAPFREGTYSTARRTCSPGRAIAPCHPAAIKPSVAGSYHPSTVEIIDYGALQKL